ncbi:PPE family protein [Mycobacterium interjectum]|uniref:PPE family protein n=1 Tax=Mycobacterium interjectum TaxID=33895 RepID=UPI00082A8795|nr:PPE family protein [Mycobacterium interjectum]MCV7092856.1 PPE family protein [Mycobacterium interjectum]
MVDFGALPPEINSARMYSGPGSGPLTTAASAWESLAAQLDSYTAGYSSILTELQGRWSGGASSAMAGAVAPFVAWAAATAARAEQSAIQARVAAAAFEAAFAATVPPPAIAANRTQLALLVATNFFGQNTPAIAANDFEYAEMWAQDAAAMYGYAASSSAASALSPFSEPPQTTNVAAQSIQSAALGQAASTSTGQTQSTVAELMSVLTRQLQALATGAATEPSSAAQSPAAAYSGILTAFSDFNTLTGPANLGAAFSRTATSATSGGSGIFRTRIQSTRAVVPPAAVGSQTLDAGGVRGAALARMGASASMGKLSVPRGWVIANAVDNPINGQIPLPDSAIQVAAAGANPSPGANMLGAIPTGHSEATRSFVLRNGRRRFEMPRPPYGG